MQGPLKSKKMAAVGTDGWMRISHNEIATNLNVNEPTAK